MKRRVALGGILRMSPDQLRRCGRINPIIIAFVMLLLYPGASISQPQQYKFIHVTEVGTMASVGTVNYIYKDSKGMMWFGTSRGLQRYDGYQLKIFDEYPKDTANTISRLVNVLFEDSRGNFWVGTNYQGLNLFVRQTEKFISYHCGAGDSTGIPNHGILSILEDHNGILWFGVIEGGIFRYDSEHGTFKQFLIDTTTSIALQNNVWCLMQDKAGKLWLTTAGGVFTFEKNTGVFSPVNPEPAPPEGYSIYQYVREDFEGNIWIGSYWGIYFLNPISQKWHHFFPDYPISPNGPSTNFIGEMQEYASSTKHEMWIASTWGLNKYDFKTGKFIHLFQDSDDPNSLRNNSSSGIYLDNNGMLWTASGGASKLDLNQNQFMHYDVKSWPDSLHNLDVTVFCEDYRGHYWLGTHDDGLYEFDNSMVFISNYKPTAPKMGKNNTSYRNRIAYIYEDSRKNLWVSTWRFSLNLFDSQRETFNSVPVSIPEGYGEPYDIEEILEDHFGVIWFGANDGLFFVRSDEIRKTPVTVVPDSVLSRDKILDIYEDSRLNIWVITLNNGVYVLPPGDRKTVRWKRFREEQYDHRGQKPARPRYVCEDTNGRIWFLSLQGLYIFDPERDIIIRHEHFGRVFPNRIYQFIPDREGYLWLVCDIGLLRYNPADTSNHPPKLYNSKDGMPYDEVHHAPLFTDRKGFIYAASWGGSGRGFFRFDPSQLKPDNTNIPPIVITDFKVRNKPFLMDSSVTYIHQIHLKHNENFFSFEFSALDYFDPSKNQYSYILEGLDEDWNYSGNRRYANYTGVAPGNYIFRVKGSNNDGYWNDEGASVKITIRKPPWNTWWSNTLYVLFVSGVLISIVWYYTKRQQLRHALEIEHLQKEQLIEVDRLKSHFFANISHEFRTPLTLILGPIEKLKNSTSDRECLQDLGIMQRNANRLRRLIDQLLSLSKIDAGQMKLNAAEHNIVPLVRGYFQSFESAARQKGIELEFKAEQVDIPLYFDRDKMEKILNNLISNAIKFTPEGGKVTMTVGSRQSTVVKNNTEDCRLKTDDLKANCVIISVADTGPGIPPEHLPHIFDRFYQVNDSDSRFQEGSGIGLALVKELLELHHGNISVQSETGKGTSFIIRLPMGKEHLKSDEMVTVISKTELAQALSLNTQQGTVDEEPEFIRFIEESVSSKKSLLLLVEDNADMRQYIHGFLHSEYRIIEANDGQHGLESGFRHIPDMVVSDVMMPGMDGYELCHKLKTDERTSHIPVILLTAKAATEDRLEGYETGADDFITKPFVPEELMVRIRNLLRQRQLLREKYRREFEHVTLVPEASMTPMEVKFMEKARKVVSENITNPEFDIGEFSSRMNMSRVQLHRKLTALFNLSASEFIRTFRLNAAARMLEARTGNVAQIAFEVGFNNLSYFSKCFRKQFGYLPSVYQQTKSIKGLG